jgi:hypothetical protein
MQPTKTGIRITLHGHEAVRDGLDGLSPGATLLLEVMARVERASPENAAQLVAQLLEHSARPRARSLRSNPAWSVS